MKKYLILALCMALSTTSAFSGDSINSRGFKGMKTVEAVGFFTMIGGGAIFLSGVSVVGPVSLDSEKAFYLGVSGAMVMALGAAIEFGGFVSESVDLVTHLAAPEKKNLLSNYAIIQAESRVLRSSNSVGETLEPILDSIACNECVNLLERNTIFLKMVRASKQVADSLHGRNISALSNTNITEIYEQNGLSKNIFEKNTNFLLSILSLEIASKN